jgi:hypothetical protein
MRIKPLPSELRYHQLCIRVADPAALIELRNHVRRAVGAAVPRPGILELRWTGDALELRLVSGLCLSCG